MGHVEHIIDQVWLEFGLHLASLTELGVSFDQVWRMMGHVEGPMVQVWVELGLTLVHLDSFGL